jgi:hypothetical protein
MFAAPPLGIPFHFAQTELDFGQVWDGAVVEKEVTLINDTAQPLAIKSIESSCGCTVASLAKMELPASASVPLKIKFEAPTAFEAYAADKQVVVVAASGAKALLSVKATVVPRITMEPTSVAPLTLEETESASREIKLLNHTKEPWQALQVTAPAGVKATSRLQGAEAWVKLEITREAMVNEDWSEEALKIKTGMRAREEIEVKLNGTRERALVMMPSPLNFGFVEAGSSVTKSAIIEHKRLGEKFEITLVETPSSEIKTELKKLKPGKYEVSLTLTPKQWEPGKAMTRAIPLVTNDTINKKNAIKLIGVVPLVSSCCNHQKK